MDKNFSMSPLPLKTLQHAAHVTAVSWSCICIWLRYRHTHAHTHIWLASADSLLSSVAKDSQEVGWSSELGVVGACEGMTLPLCAAPTDKDAVLSFGRVAKGGSSAVDCPTPTGSCLLVEDEPEPPFPLGSALTTDALGSTSGVVPASPSPSKFAKSGRDGITQSHTCTHNTWTHSHVHTHMHGSDITAACMHV